MNYPLDGNAIATDAHYDQPDPIGHEDGETCNRVHEPDEDNPRPKPCKGVMEYYVDAAVEEHEIDDPVINTRCDTCGEIED
jgi:hypothetical protein